MAACLIFDVIPLLSSSKSKSNPFFLPIIRMFDLNISSFGIIIEIENAPFSYGHDSKFLLVFNRINECAGDNGERNANNNNEEASQMVDVLSNICLVSVFFFFFFIQQL
eukprot:430678_1